MGGVAETHPLWVTIGGKGGPTAFHRGESKKVFGISIRYETGISDKGHER